MFNEKLKRSLAITLIFAMFMTGQGFTTLAASVEDVVQEAEYEKQEEGQKNYYRMMQIEEHEEITIIREEVAEEPIDEASVDSEADNQEDLEIADDASLLEVAPEDVDEPEYDDEPEIEEEPEEDNSSEEIADADSNDSVELENEPSNEDSSVENLGVVDENETTETETETTMEETTETETTTVVETTIEETEEATDSEIVETETETETTIEDVDATVSEVVEKVDEEIASVSELDEIDMITDLKSTASTLGLVDDITEVSEATKSITVTKYIIATRSKIATTSIWTIKRYLIDETSGSFFGSLPTDEDMKEKYLPKTMKIYLEDQLGNEKVVEVPVNWKITTLVAGLQKPEKGKRATIAYVPRELENKGVKLNEENTGFAEDSVNVAEIEEQQKVDAQIAEGYESIRREEESESLVESIEEENRDAAETYVEETDATYDIPEEVIDDIEETTGMTYDETVGAFTLTEEEPEEEPESENDGDTEESTTVTEDGNDAKVDNVEIIEKLEDAEVTKVSEEEKTSEGFQGDVNTQVANENNATEIVQAAPDMNALFNALMGVMPDDIIVGDLTSPMMTLFGITPLCAHNGTSGTRKFDPTNTWGPSYTGSTNGAGNQGNLKTGITGGTGYVALSGDVLVDETIDCANNNVYICLNGSKLTFGKNDTTGTVGKLVNAKNVIICNCTGNGIVSGLNGTGATAAPYDRYETREDGNHSVSCIEAHGQYIGIIGKNALGGTEDAPTAVGAVEVKDIFSNVHDKTKFKGQDDAVAAFITATGSVSTQRSVMIKNAYIHNLTGAQGGALKVEDVTSAVIEDNNFRRNMAFMGGCYNLTFHENTGSSDKTETLSIKNNIIKENSFAFFYYNDHNLYTFGRFPFPVTSYYETSDVGDINATTTINEGAETTRSAQLIAMKPEADCYQYQNIGYEMTTYPYEANVKNAICLVDMFGGKDSGSKADIEENKIKDNMPFSLCGTFEIALNNYLCDRDGGAGTTTPVKMAINVIKNEIIHNAQYKSSADDSTIAGGMTISVNPDSWKNHYTITYEKSLKYDGETKKATEYELAKYQNNERGAAGKLVWYNNIIDKNYSYSTNTAGVSINNIYEVEFGKQNTLSDSKIIKDNVTQGKGAAVSFYSCADVTVKNTKFTNNNSVTSGGAVALLACRKVLFDNDGEKDYDNAKVGFKENYARTMGGAVYASDSEFVKFKNVPFEKNYLVSGSRFVTTNGISDIFRAWYYGSQQGDMVYVGGGKTAISKTSKPIPYNISEAYTFGVHDPDSPFYNSTTFTNWKGVNPVGGGSVVTLTPAADQNIIYTYKGSAIGATNDNIGKGGAVAIVSSKKDETYFEDCDFKDNISSYTGGGIFASTKGGLVTIKGSEATRSIIDGNLAGRSAGFMYTEDTRATISYADITHNRSEQGGAFFLYTNPDNIIGYTQAQKEAYSGFYVGKSKISENEFLKDTDKTPYEDFVMPTETFNSSKYYSSGDSIALNPDNWEKFNDGDYHWYKDINNEAKHTVHLTGTLMPLRKTTESTARFNSGGAIYTYANVVRFDKGAYLTKNVNTLYSIAGSTILTRQEANHETVDPNDEITITENTGEYIFGHWSTFKAEFEFYGGKIINNTIDTSNKNTKQYTFVQEEVEERDKPGGSGTYKVYSYPAAAISKFKKAEERVVKLGGNIMIKENKVVENGATSIENLGLEESADYRDYKFELNKDNKLHPNAQIYLTPKNPNKMRYQLFNATADTKEHEEAKSESDRKNRGLWTTDWFVTLDGAVPQTIFKNDYGDSTNDGRIIYVANNDSRNEPGTTVDFGQIYLENPNNLFEVKFDLLDKDKDGNHRYDNQLLSQYFTEKAKIQSPLSSNFDLMKFSTDSTLRLLDICGYTDFDGLDKAEKRFHSWPWDQKVTEKEMPKQGDNRSRNLLFAINAMTNHRHKICGTPEGVPCNHPDGVNHDAEEFIFGDREVSPTGLQASGSNITIEVATLAQLMYMREHPEYMYVLANDLVIDSETEYVWNRKVGGVLNDANNPIKNAKICLNGHNIIMNIDDDIASIFGENCYICNCKPVETHIRYGQIEGEDPTQTVKRHNHYSKDYVFDIQNKTGNTNLNIYGNKDGNIVIDNLYMPSVKNTLVDIGEGDKFSAEYLRFENIGYDEYDTERYATGSYLNGSLLDLQGETYLRNISFKNIYQTLSIDPKDKQHVQGQGIVRLTDNAGVIQKIENVTFDDIRLNRQRSGLIVVNNSKDNNLSKLTISTSSFTNIVGGGKGAIMLNEGADAFYGEFVMQKCTFSNIHPNNNVSTNIQGIGFYAKNFKGTKFVIKDTNFESVGIDKALLSGYTSAYGGAIYIGKSQYGASGGQDNTRRLEFTNLTFKDCNSANGGAMYLDDTYGTDITNCKFTENIAKYGSAIYQNSSNETDSTKYNQGKTVLTDVVFENNGDNGDYGINTNGAYYNKSYALAKRADTETAGVEIKNIIAKGNKGAVPVFLIEYQKAKNKIVFIGTTSITENIGGPVFQFNSSDNGSEPVVEFRDDVTIASNSVGTSYAFYANVKTNVTIAFADKVNILDNTRPGVNQEANVFLNSRLSTKVIEGEKIDMDNTKIYFSSDTNNKTIATWNNTTIKNIYKPNLMLMNHFIPDNEATNEYKIYKENNDLVKMGRWDDENFLEIVGHISSASSTTFKMRVKKGATNVLLDNFDTPSETTPFAGFGATTFGGWIIKNMDGEYVPMQLGTTRFNVEDDTSLDALWITNHAPHTTGYHAEEEYYIAYNEAIIRAYKDKKFVLANDVSLSKALTDTNKNFTICLNGHFLSRKENINLININSGTNLGFNIMNCYHDDGNNGGINVLSTGDTSFPLIKIASLSVPVEANIDHVMFKNIKYDGAEEGILINAENAKINLDHIMVGKESGERIRNQLLYIKNSETTMIGEDSSAIDKIDPANDSNYNLSFPGLNPRSASGLYCFEGGKVTIDNIGFGNIEYSAQNRPVLSFVDNEEVTIKNSNFENLNNTYTSGFGAAIYVKNVANMLISTTSFVDNEAANGSALYIEDCNTRVSNITINNFKFNNNKATRFGGTIYHKNSTVGDDKYLKLKFIVGPDTDTISSEATQYNGGFLLMDSDASNETNVDEVEFDLTNYPLRVDGSKAIVGGFIYAKDTKITFTGSKAAHFSNCEAVNGDGGAFYLDRAKLIFDNGDETDANVNTFDGCKASGKGAAIYSSGEANTGLVTKGLDEITLKNVVFGKTTHNNSTSDNGIVALGEFTDLYLDGRVNFCDNAVRNLYEFVRTTGTDKSKIVLSLTGVKREIKADYKYAISTISATTEYYDKTVITKYTDNNANPFGGKIFADDSYNIPGVEPYVVYKSGAKTSLNIHIGNTLGRAKFYIGDATIKMKDTTKYGTGAISGVELYNNYFESIPYDTGYELEEFRAAGSDGIPQRTGYTFAGWVTYIQASESEVGYYLKNFELSDAASSLAYLPSTDDVLDIVAVWKKDGGADNGKYVIEGAGEALYFNEGGNEATDMSYIVEGDVVATRTNLPIIRTGKTTIDGKNNIFTMVNDLEMFVESTKTAKFEIKDLNFVNNYKNTKTNELILKNKPFIKASELVVDNVKFKDFKMGVNFVDVDKLDMKNSEVTNNVNISFTAPYNATTIDNVEFRDNNDSLTKQTPVEELSLLYLTTPSSTSGTGIIKNSKFINNTLYYSLVETFLAANNGNGNEFKIENTEFNGFKAKQQATTPHWDETDDYESLIKVSHKHATGSSVGTLKFDKVTITNPDTTKPSYYINIVDAYDTNLDINNSTMSNINTIRSNLIYQRSSAHDDITINVKDTEIKNNSMQLASETYTIYRKKKLDIVDTYDNVDISGNKSNYALYSEDKDGNANNGQYKFMNKVYIYANEKQSSGGNIYLVASATNTTFAFGTGTNMLKRGTKIGVTLKDAKEGMPIVKDNWTDAVHNPTNEEDEGHLTYKVFEIDKRTPNYSKLTMVKKNTDIIICTDANNFNKVEFKLNYSTLSDITNYDTIKDDLVQNVYKGYEADKVDYPRVNGSVNPSSPAPNGFIKWMIPSINDSTIWKSYNFTNGHEDSKTYSTRSEIVAVYNRNVKISVWANAWGNAGGITSGEPYGNTNLDGNSAAKIVYTVKQGETLNAGTNEKVIYKYTGDAASHTLDPIPTVYSGTVHMFTRDGLNEKGWYISNGWNKGANDRDWGTEWKYNESTVLFDGRLTCDASGKNIGAEEDGNIYVKWVGAEYNISYAGNKGTGSTDPVVTTNSTTIGKGYYGSRLSAGDPGKINLADAARPGYTFVAWHSTTSFAAANVVDANKTFYNWPNDMTFYAEWKKNDYKVKYIAEESDDAAGTMKDSVLTFDTENKLLANKYVVHGKDFDKWVSTDSETHVVHEYTNEQVATFNMTTRSNATVYLAARWKPQVRTLTYNLMDTITNTTTRATISTLSKVVTYSSAIGTLETPTRPGYTFRGWMYTKDAAKASDIDEELLATPGVIFDENANTAWNAYSITSDRAKMKDVTLYARWENNLYTIIATSGVADSDPYPVDESCEEQKVDTAFDYQTNIVGIPTTQIQFVAKQFKREGYDYKGLFGEYNGKKATINNVTSAVKLAKGTELYNLGMDDIASGSTIVLTASWSEWIYTLKLNSGHTKYKDADGNVLTLTKGATESIIIDIPYTRDFKLSDIATPYELEGYQFNGFGATKDIAALSFDDVVNGATLSVIKTGQVVELTGTWVKNGYKIRYIKSTDSAVEAKISGGLNEQSVNVGDPVTLYNPNKSSVQSGTAYVYDGHVFDKWVDTETLATYSSAEKVQDLRTEVNAIATLSATWKVNKYSIKFNVNVPKSPIQDRPNVAVGTKSDLLDLEYDKEYDIGTPGYIVDGYDVYMFGNKTSIGSSTIKVTPSDTTYTNLVNAKDNLGDIAKTKDGQIINLYLHYKPRQYKVALDMNDGNSDTKAVPATTSLMFTYDAKYGDTYTQIMKGQTLAPNRPGYNFDGWTREPIPATVDSTTKIGKSEYFKPATLNEVGDPVETFYAHWKPAQFKLTMDANTIDGQTGHIGTSTGRSTNTIKVKYDIPIKDNATTTLKDAYLGGYEFTYYATVPEASDEHITEDTIFGWNAADSTIYAHYKPIKYYIAFSTGSDADVEGTMATMSVTYGDDSTGVLTAIDESTGINSFRKKGHTFKNWTYTNKETVYNQLTKNNVKANYDDKATASRIRESSGSTAILTPNWTEHKYTITFDPATSSLPSTRPHDVTGNMNNINLKYTQEYKLPKNTYAIAGYTFTGWKATSGEIYDDQETISKLGGSAYGAAGEDNIVKLSATWQAATYSVTLHKGDVSENRGTSVATLCEAGVEKDEVITIIATYDSPFPASVLTGGKYTATRSGYTFMGWTKESRDLTWAEKTDPDTNNVLIKADTLYDIAGNGNIYPIWKNDKLNVKLTYNTITFGSNVPHWPGSTTDTGDKLLDDEYFDMTLGTGIDPDRDELLIPECQGYQFANWFAGPTAPALDAWREITEASTVPSGYTKVINGATQFKKELLDYVVGDTLTLYGLWVPGKVYLRFVSTYSNSYYGTWEGGYVDKEVKYLQAIGNANIPQGALTEDADKTGKFSRIGYRLDKWMSYKTDPVPASPSEDKEITGSTLYWETIKNATAYAVWKPRDYDVMFSKYDTAEDADSTITWDRTTGSTASGDYRKGTYTYDKTYIATDNIPTLKRDGYTFLYWSPDREIRTNSKKYYPDQDFTMDIFANNTTLYGHWEGKKYIVNWDLWGMRDGDNNRYAEGVSTPTLATAITNSDGVSFVGNVDVVTSSVAYRAAFKTGFGIALPDPKRTGYKFNGWWSNDPRTNKQFFTENEWNRVPPHYAATQKIEKDTLFTTGTIGVNNLDSGKIKADGITFYALWVPEKAHTIEYVFEGAEKKDIVMGNVFGNAGLPAAYVILGDKFSKARAIGSVVDNGSTKIPAANITGNIYSDNIYKDSSTPEYHVYPENGVDTPTYRWRGANNLVREGYDFLGFTTARGITVTPSTVFTEADIVGGKAQLTAHFRPRQYKVKFIANDMSQNKGDTIRINGVDRDFYDIATVSWTLADGTTTTDLANYNFIATFGNAFGTLPNPTEPDGYEFKGWYTRNGANGGLMYTSGDNNGTAWGKDVGKVESTTVFDLNLESIKNGYRWENTTSDKTRAEDKMVARNIELYARWERKEITVSFDSNKGSSSTDPTSITGGNINKAWYGLPIKISNMGVVRNVPSCSMNGYTFKGWSTSPTATEAMDPEYDQLIVAPGVTSQTIYAVWEADKYDVYLDVNRDKLSRKTVSIGGSEASKHNSDVEYLSYDGNTADRIGPIFTIEFDSPVLASTTHSEILSNAKIITRVGNNASTEEEGFNLVGFTWNKSGTEDPYTAGANLNKDTLKYATSDKKIVLYAKCVDKQYGLTVEKSIHTEKDKPFGTVTGSVSANSQNITDIKYNQLLSESGALKFDLSHDTYKQDGFEFVGLSRTNQEPSDSVTVDFALTNGKLEVTRLSTGSNVTLYSIFKPIHYSLTYKNTQPVGEFRTSTTLPSWYNYYGETNLGVYIPDDTKGWVINEPVRSGYIFKSWASDAPWGTATYVPGTSTVSQITIVPGQITNVEIGSYWQAGSIEIIFHRNDGSGLVEYGGAFIGLSGQTTIPTFAWSNVSDPNKIITGWSVDPQGRSGYQAYTTNGTVYGNIETGAGEIHLYAIWGNPSSNTSAGSSRRSGGGGGGGGGGGAGGAAAGQQAASSLNPAFGTITNKAVNDQISVNLGRSNVAAQGNWRYDQNLNTWSFEIQGNLANNSNGDNMAHSGWYLVQAAGTSKAWYKFDTNGNMVVGLQKEPSGNYYANPDPTSPDFGAMMVGWVNIGGFEFYFDENGRMLSNGVTPDGWLLNEIGAKVQKIEGWVNQNNLSLNPSDTPSANQGYQKAIVAIDPMFQTAGIQTIQQAQSINPVNAELMGPAV